MPELLQKFLSDLSDADADKVWLYLDGNPDAIEEMITLIAKSHPHLNEQVQQELIKVEV